MQRGIRPLFAVLCLLAAGCAGTPAPSGPQTVTKSRSSRIIPDDLECVPYARNHSAVKIYGDAYLWWEKANGVYVRRDTPVVGSVMVLDGYAGSERAHVAVVRKIESGHQIRVDHANWLNNGDVHLDDAVRDVSRAQNWTRVRIFDLQTGQWGRRDYHVRGFIGPERAGKAPQKKPPQSIGDLISFLSPDDLPRTTAPENTGQH